LCQKRLELSSNLNECEPLVAGCADGTVPWVESAEFHWVGRCRLTLSNPC